MPRHFTRWPVVEGYPDRQSVTGGDTVEMKCSSRVPRFSAEVSRVGVERTVVWRRDDIPGVEQDVPERAFEQGCGWATTFTIDVDPAWPSGFYEVRLHAPGDGSRQASSEAFFVVRAPAGEPTADSLLVLATNTWNAYNQWGGGCLYTGEVRVSFDRPIERGYLRRPAAPLETDYDGRVASLPEEPDFEHRQMQQYLADHEYPLWCGSGSFHNWERRFIQWAERSGIALDLAISSDLDRRPEVLDGHRLLLSVGHDEYWSWGMRDAADAFVDAGGSWAIFSGNTAFWQVRYEDDGRTMVCYKGQALSKDPVLGTDEQHTLTGMWATPLIGRPEASSFGLSFTRGGYGRVGHATPRTSGGFTVHRPEHPIFAGTNLHYGDVLGGPSRIVGYELDGCELTMVNGDPVPTYADGTPEGFEVLATAPARLISITADHCEAPPALWASVAPPGDLEDVATVLFGDASPENTARIAHNHAVVGMFERGQGRVFHAGTTDWAYGLDADPQVQQVTANVVHLLLLRS